MGQVALSDEHAGFVALAQKLREMGATRVRAGALEVAFAPVQPDEADPTPAKSERVDYALEQAKILVREQRQELGA